MKKFYTLIVLSFLILVNAKAQVIVYHENFNNAVSGVSQTNFVLSNADPYTDSLYTGGSYEQTDKTVGGQFILTISNNISTYNLQAVTITWKEYRSQFFRKGNGDIVTSANGNAANIPNTNPVSLEYSLDGENYTQVTGFSQNTTKFFEWGAVNNGTPIQLPFAVYNQPNVRFRWKINMNNTNSDYYAIDDVMIKGTPITGTSTFKWSSRPDNESPFTVSSETSAEPYKVDGVTIRWTRTSIGTGTAVETDKVGANFQSKKLLNLIQSGASSTAGTQLILKLGQRVSGLTFTMYNIDRKAGQFKDKIEVIGYDGTTAVPLTKNSMLPTISNEYSNGFVVAKADGVDAKVTSNNSNVTVSFVANVDKVVIKYYNDDVAKGRQGIAIGDLSWAMLEMSIAPMPVELANFKAQALNGKSVLSWATASEENNDKFIVERSRNGKSFAPIGAVNGKGNSSVAINYSFTDAAPAAGVNYYRLRQVDFGGTVTYSKTIALEFLSKLAELETKPVLYPTVTSDVVNISLAGSKNNVVVNVLDATGKPVKQMSGSAGREVQLQVRDLKSGAYFVTVTDGASLETLRFVKR